MKITVYITSKNYGKYLDECITSVMDQSFQDFELFLVDDGSTDNTNDIMQNHKSKHEWHKNIEVITHKESKGLVASANEILSQASGEYIIRVDGDDYLDPQCLLILSTYLDNNKLCGIVYPDYIEISEDGNNLSHIMKNKIENNNFILDLPCHGACTLIRKSFLIENGGYNPSIDCQDGYDLWLKFFKMNKPSNINLPLFFYRKHGKSLSDKKDKILASRRKIKQNHIETNEIDIPKTLVVIPFKDDYNRIVNDDLLLNHTLYQVLESKCVNDVLLVSSEKVKLPDWKDKNISLMHRPKDLEKLNTPIEKTINYILPSIDKSFKQIMILYINAPLRKAEHIDEAIYTQEIFKTNSVVSVTMERQRLYRHTKSGLSPLFKERVLRRESDDIYKENGAIFLSRISSITQDSFISDKVGHINMEYKNSHQIDSDLDIKIVEAMINA